MNITVAGTHRISMPPERATLHLTVGCESDDPQTAMRDASNTANELHEALKMLRASIPSPITWFAVLPIRTRSWTPWNKDGLVLPARFAATSDIKVKFSDFTAMSQFALMHGSQMFVKLNRVEWALTEVTKADLDRKVLAGAVQDAAFRASQIAEAVGATGVEAVEIADPGLLSGISNGSGGDGGHTLGKMAVGSARGGSAPEAIDLAPEDIDVWAAVHARFITQP